MASYKKFKGRFTSKHSEAVKVNEKKAESWIISKGLSYVRYGLDALSSNVPIWKVHEFVRSAPDYIVFKDDEPKFLETKVFRDSVKVKIRDLNNYLNWSKYMDLAILFIDTSKNTCCCIMYKTLTDIIKQRNPEIKSYPESKNNKYYDIDPEWLPKFNKL